MRIVKLFWLALAASVLAAIGLTSCQKEALPAAQVSPLAQPDPTVGLPSDTPDEQH